MTRRNCPSCGERVDDPRLIACPTCGTVFSEFESSQLDLLRDHKDALAAEVAERVQSVLQQLQQQRNELVAETAGRARHLIRWELIGAVLFILIVAGYGLFQVYSSVKSFAATFISDQIAIRFAESHIQATMQQAAEWQAAILMENVINPEVLRVKGELKSEVEGLQSFVRTVKEDIHKEISEKELLRQWAMVVPTGEIAADIYGLSVEQGGKMAQHHQKILEEKDLGFHRLPRI